MKITIEHYDIKVTCELPDGIDIYDLMLHIKNLLVSIGYTETTVLNGFRYIIEEFDDNEMD